MRQCSPVRQSLTPTTTYSGGGLRGASAMVEQPCKRVQGSEEGRNISVEEEMKEVGHADQREARQGGEHGAVTADEVTSGEEMERQQNKKKWRMRMQLPTTTERGVL
jgi:hypothetical protein